MSAVLPDKAASVATMQPLPAVPGRGWVTLFYKELLRFWKVAFQTLLAPILTALLYLLIFSHVLESRVSVFDGRVTYTALVKVPKGMLAVMSAGGIDVAVIAGQVVGGCAGGVVAMRLGGLVKHLMGAKARHKGYFEGQGYQVTWALGHLGTLKEPEDYDPALKRWTLATLPFVPDRFELNHRRFEVSRQMHSFSPRDASGEQMWIGLIE